MFDMSLRNHVFVHSFFYSIPQTLQVKSSNDIVTLTHAKTTVDPQTINVTKPYVYTNVFPLYTGLCWGLVYKPHAKKLIPLANSKKKQL